ncbi:BON domain-containing protein [Novosphingobium sp. BL-8H]|uniref:BON domain-containing protein n=1 Tax=Novosphingobium sp. BL-8H TaxID=3127640 RepID=UPI003756F845
MRSGGSYRQNRDPDGWNSVERNEYGEWRSYGEERGFFERASDEVASWFGNDDAARRRENDHRENGRREKDYRGRGPSDYTRSDERIREDANERLTADWQIDASHVKVSVSGGEVTLEGQVASRPEKRRAEDIAHDISGVKHVQNNLRVGPGIRLGDTGSETIAGTRSEPGVSTS